MQYCRGGKISKRSSPGSDFTDPIFTGEFSWVDLAGVLRQGVYIYAIYTTYILYILIHEIYYIHTVYIYIYIYFFSIITLYTKNVKQIKNTINSAPITIYVVEGKLNVKKRKKKVN